MKHFRVGLVGLLVATSVIFVPSASADPDAVKAAKADLDRIHEESAALDAQIIEAASRASDAETKLASLDTDLAAQEEKVGKLSDDLGDLAMLQLNSGGLDITSQLLSSGTDSSFLSGLSTIQNETDRSNSDLQALQVEQARLDVLRDDQESTTKSLQEDKAAKERLMEDYKEKEAEAQAVFDRLNAEEQERLRELERQRAAEEAARQNASPSPSPGGDDKAKPEDPPVSEGGGGSDRASQALSVAMSKRGSSYVFGATGPGSFDCSGLMVYAYKQVGISLPRTSNAQYGAGSAVSKGDLRPGDLVFYYGSLSHVGMYIGNGQIVHAANPRSGVVVAGLDSMPYVGARRVG